MGDTKTTLTWLLKDQVSGPAKGVNDALGNLEKKAGSSGGLLGKLGAATGGLVNPMSLALGGVGLLAGGLIAAGKAAADEQINVERMNTALKASIPGFDGNTDAIEKLIAQRENLGFSDDALRASLATLVTSTHDVSQAQDLQSLAMDLARLKGIDLGTATDALAKANVGSTKELKALGITVDDSKDKTQVFAAIQKAAAGQSEAYAKTTAGRWETLQNKLGDVVETVGSAVLPIFDALASFAVDTLIPAIQGFADVIGPILGGAFKILGTIIGTFIERVVKPAIAVIQGIIYWVKQALKFLGILHDESPTTAPTAFSNSQHAVGGQLSAGWNLVGEQGPELISPSRQVYTAGQTQGMLGGGGSPVEISVQIDGREIGRVVDSHLYLALSAAGGGPRSR